MSAPVTPDGVYQARANQWIKDTLRSLDQMETKKAVQTMLLSREMTLGFMRILLGISIANLSKGHREKAKQFLEVAQIIAGLHLATIDIAAHAANQPKKDTQA